MNYFIYLIYDKISEQYAAPFCSLNDATAARQFHQTIRANALAEPSDFELYCCGNFSTDSGQIVPCFPLRFIIKG